MAEPQRMCACLTACQPASLRAGLSVCLPALPTQPGVLAPDPHSACAMRTPSLWPWQMVTTQHGQMEQLRSAAAAAQVQSSSAQQQLLELRSELARRQAEQQQESLATILASPPGFGAEVAPRVYGAYHPQPIKETCLGLDLPAPLGAVPQQQAGGAPREPAASSAAILGQQDWWLDGLGGGPSAGGLGYGGAVRNDAAMQPGGSFSPELGERGWERSTSRAAALRGSMLVSDSTFLYPSGLQPAGGGGLQSAFPEAAASSGDALRQDMPWGAEASGLRGGLQSMWGAGCQKRAIVSAPSGQLLRMEANAGGWLLLPDPGGWTEQSSVCAAGAHASPSNGAACGQAIHTDYSRQHVPSHVHCRRAAAARW